MESLYLKALSAFISLFEESEEKFGYKYMLVGGVLTSIYAEARQTQDVDILIQVRLSQDSKLNLQKIFQKYNFQPITNWEDVFLNWNSNQFIQILDPDGIVKLDINLAGSLPKNDSIYEKIKFLALKNRKRHNFNGMMCWIQGMEDFILSKLVYGGYQDYKDALACWIRYNQKLNVEYLLKNAKELGIKEVYQALTHNYSVDKVFPDD